MCRSAPILSALLAVSLLAAGCGGSPKRPVYEVPPLAKPGEDKPVDEVSENLALALGPSAGGPESLEARRKALPRDLLGDQQNAAYSGQRLTGSAAVPGAPAAPTPPENADEAPAPDAAPRVPVVPAPTPPSSAPSTPQATAPSPAETAVPPASPAPAAPPAPEAPATAPAAPQPRIANTASGGRVVVQVASFRTRANAEGGWQRLRAAHPGLLGDRALILQEADLGERGVYYRIRTGPFSDTNEARDFCAQLRARDQGCVVINPN